MPPAMPTNVSLFGKPIGHNQMIQGKLALMAIKIDNMRNMVTESGMASRSASVTAHSARRWQNCIAHVPQMEVMMMRIQIMGGLGYTDEARVSRFWRDVRCERIGGGYRRNYDLRSRSADPERLSEQNNLRRRSFLTNCAARFINKTYRLRKFRWDFLFRKTSF